MGNTMIEDAARSFFIFENFEKISKFMSQNMYVIRYI